MADDLKLIGSLIGIEAPWQVAEYRLLSGQNRLEVWIAPQQAKSWFARGQRMSTASGLASWRHVSLCGRQCHVYFPSDLLDRLGDLPWSCDAALPFSRALTREILALLEEGVGYRAICEHLSIPFADLWKYKFALEHGRLGSKKHTRPKRPVHDDAVPSQGAAAASLPEPDAAVWECLLVGAADIDIHALSLQLLVTRLRAQMKTIDDPDLRRLKIRELQRYFVRHENLLGHELAQLHRLNPVFEGI